MKLIRDHPVWTVIIILIILLWFFEPWFVEQAKKAQHKAALADSLATPILKHVGHIGEGATGVKEKLDKLTHKHHSQKGDSTHVKLADSTQRRGD